MQPVRRKWIVLGLILAAGLAGCRFGAEKHRTVDIYLSPAGNDNNPGTAGKPIRTLEKARDMIRNSEYRGRIPVVVWMQSGRYFRTQTFSLSEQDSGTAEAPVSYRAVTRGAVVLDGGITIPSAACVPVTDPGMLNRFLPEAKEKILQIDLKALGVTDYGTLGPRGFSRAYRPAPLELFINGQPLQIARWPNEGEPHIPLGQVIDSGSDPRHGDYSFRGGVFKYDTPRVERWLHADDLYISGLFFYGYADDTLPVAEIDTSAKTIRTAVPHLYSFTNRSFTAWYALNLIEEIDVPGEYCVDKRSGILYFYPPCDMKNAQIQVSILEAPLVAMEGTSHVYLENLTFENTRGTAVYIERGDSSSIIGCTMRNLGIVGVQVGQGASPLPDGLHNGHGEFGKETKECVPISREIGSLYNHIYAHTAWNREGGRSHSIRSCDIYNTGAGGIILGGGDRKTLAPAGNSVEGCDIHDVTRLDRLYRACINIDGVGNRITHCELHHTAGQAVLLHGNDHRIEFNRIHDVLTDQSDMGAVYMGRDPSEAGNLFRFNFFYNIFNHHEGGYGVQAIFFDDMSICGATVFGNIFYKTGSSGVIKFNGGGLSPIVNNIFIDCPQPVYLNSSNNTERVQEFMVGDLGIERLRHALDILAPPYVDRYPQLKEVYEHKIPVSIDFERNIIVNGDLSCFENPENLDFSLKPEASVLKEVPGFQPIPFDQIGDHVDPSGGDISQ